MGQFGNFLDNFANLPWATFGVTFAAFWRHSRQRCTFALNNFRFRVPPPQFPHNDDNAHASMRRAADIGAANVSARATNAGEGATGGVTMRSGAELPTLDRPTPELAPPSRLGLRQGSWGRGGRGRSIHRHEETNHLPAPCCVAIAGKARRSGSADSTTPHNLLNRFALIISMPLARSPQILVCY